MKIKQIPEDFIVQEIIDLDIKEEGEFTYFKLTKRNYNTLDAINRISDALHTRSIFFAGNKDKFAVTEQYCSIKGDYRSQLEKLELKDIEIEVIGMGNEHIYLGKLKGNNFEITIREIEGNPEVKETFVNYFGPQRFGGNNVEIGRKIVKEKFHPHEPKKQMQLYIHAYQSWIWNNCVKRIIAENIDKKTCPIVGFGTEYDSQDVKKIVKEELKKESITERSFIIKHIPEISAEGDERDIYVEVKDLKISELEENNLGDGEKVTISFFLPKGSYATTFLESINFRKSL